MLKKLSLLFIAAAIAGCVKQDPITPPVIQPLGIISGSAFLFDNNCDSLQSSGILVSVSGTKDTTLTDASGNWRLKEPAGNYTLTFTKNGYGAMKIFNVKTTGKDTVTVDEAALTVPTKERLNFQMLRVFETADSTPGYYVQGTMEQKLETRSIVLFISRDSASLAADLNSAEVALPFTITGDLYEGGFEWNSSSSFSTDTTSLPHGAKIYSALAIYGCGEGVSNYFDPTLNKQIFTTLGPHSQILRQVIP